MKKGFLHHPVTWIIVALIIGFLLAFLMAKGILPQLGIPFCPAP